MSMHRTLMPNFTAVDLKMWPYGSKNRRKIVIFGKNLPLGENYGGRYENLNIGAQLQTFLYAMKP